MAKSDLVLVVERGSLHDIRDALGNRSVYTLISFLCLIFVFSVIVIFFNQIEHELQCHLQCLPVFNTLLKNFLYFLSQS